MTYCVAIHCDQGLVLCSDSRASKGADNSVNSKMHRFVWSGNRVITILTAGDISTAQEIMSKVRQDLEQASPNNLFTIKSLNEIADYLANISTKTQQSKKNTHKRNHHVELILAGQIGTQAMETLLIYPQGNYIFESDASPFLQIGETKYGKPILDRIINRNITLQDAARCALISMDSTIRSNSSVGPPIELLIYQNNKLEIDTYESFSDQDNFANKLSNTWNASMKNVLEMLPRFSWEA